MQLQTHAENLLEIQHLSKTCPIKHPIMGHTIGKIHAVNGVSFTLNIKLSLNGLKIHN